MTIASTFKYKKSHPIVCHRNWISRAAETIAATAVATTQQLASKLTMLLRNRNLLHLALAISIYKWTYCFIRIFCVNAKTTQHSSQLINDAKEQNISSLWKIIAKGARKKLEKKIDRWIIKIECHLRLIWSNHVCGKGINSSMTGVKLKTLCLKWNRIWEQNRKYGHGQKESIT